MVSDAAACKTDERFAVSPHKQDQAVIVEAVHTPVGRHNGVFASTRSDELGATVLNELVRVCLHCGERLQAEDTLRDLERKRMKECFDGTL